MVSGVPDSGLNLVDNGLSQEEGKKFYLHFSFIFLVMKYGLKS